MSHTHPKAKTPRPDATEAALSLILPPTALKVFRAYLQIVRITFGDPRMPMREALELMDDDCGFDELESVACAYVEYADRRKTAPLTDRPTA